MNSLVFLQKYKRIGLYDLSRSSVKKCTQFMCMVLATAKNLIQLRAYMPLVVFLDVMGTLSINVVISLQK
jgi:hypothetical protein